MENQDLTKQLEDLTKQLGLKEEESEAFTGIMQLLSLPDEQFDLLAPVFLQNITKVFRSTSTQLAVTQELEFNAAERAELNSAIEDMMEIINTADDAELSPHKKSFVRQIIAEFVNLFNYTTGLQKEIIKIAYEKVNEDSKEPTYAHLSDSGMDIYATEDLTINPGETVLVKTGIKVALPPGYEFQVRPKSGISLKSKLRVANAPGTIDAGYRDEIGIIIDNIEPPIKSIVFTEDGTIKEGSIEYGAAAYIEKGQKIAQLVLAEVPKASFYEVEKVMNVANVDEDRQGGFGSTGLK